MSDPKPDDRANQRPPEANPADAAARLAELLAKPLEPVARSRDGAPVHRDIPLLRPERWTTPADATKSDGPARLPPVSVVRPPDASSTPGEPVWSPSPPAPGEAGTDEAPSDAKTARAEPDDAEPDDLTSDGSKRDDTKSDKAKTDAAMAELVDAMAMLVDRSVRHSDAAPPTDNAGNAQDELPPAEPASALSVPSPAFSDTPAPLNDQAPTPADGAIEPVEAAIKSLRPAAKPPGEAPDAEAPLDPAAARIVKRVRRLMLISSLTTVIGVGAIFGVIGYRIFRSADMLPAPPPAPAPPVPAPPVTAPAPVVPTEVTLALPKDARIVMTAVAEDRLVITLDINGTIEIRTYDLKTLQPLARMSFTTVP